jgi:hypothetical protein
MPSLPRPGKTARLSGCDVIARRRDRSWRRRVSGGDI